MHNTQMLKTNKTNNIPIIIIIIIILSAKQKAHYNIIYTKIS